MFLFIQFVKTHLRMLFRGSAFSSGYVTKDLMMPYDGNE